MKIKGNVLIKLFKCNLTSNDSAVNKKKKKKMEMVAAQDRRTGAEDFKAAGSYIASQTVEDFCNIGKYNS